MTARTLKLRARPAQIGPGKAYLSTLVGVRAIVEATRVPASAERGPPLPWRTRLTYTDKALWLLSCLDFDDEANLARVSSNKQAAALIVVAHVAWARFEHRAFIKTGELQRATS